MVGSTIAELIKQGLIIECKIHHYNCPACGIKFNIGEEEKIIEHLKIPIIMNKERAFMLELRQYEFEEQYEKPIYEKPIIGYFNERREILSWDSGGEQHTYGNPIINSQHEVSYQLMFLLGKHQKITSEYNIMGKFINFDGVPERDRNYNQFFSEETYKKYIEPHIENTGRFSFPIRLLEKVIKAGDLKKIPEEEIVKIFSTGSEYYRAEFPYLFEPIEMTVEEYMAKYKHK